MPTKVDSAKVAADLRVVLGQLTRRLRAEHRFPLQQGAVLGRLERCGAQSVSDLAAAERVRHQSMAQTVGDLEDGGFVTRRPDPGDRRRALIELTDDGRRALEVDRARKDGWLAGVIADDFAPADLDVLERATELLRRLAES